MPARDWQIRAASAYATAVQSSKNFLLEAGTGTGKTVAAILLLKHEIEVNGRKRCGIVVPTNHLKHQWAQSIERITGYQFSPNYNPRRGWPGAQFKGIVVTYQQMANCGKELADLLDGAVWLQDEIHHAGMGPWGTALEMIQARTAVNIGLSATLFRTDGYRIPGVTYVKDTCKPDFRYPYKEAIADKIVRPVIFVTHEGEISWREAGGDYCSNFGDDGFPEDRYPRRLQIALMPEMGWLTPMLKEAHEMLLKVRQKDPKAGGLAVADDQDHARKIAALMAKELGITPVLVLSDESESTANLNNFINGRGLWLVSCNMVSEGVDVPRLRVGVFAKRVTTRLYFIQFMGRLVRLGQGDEGFAPSYCYMPADPRLVAIAKTVEDDIAELVVLKPTGGGDEEGEGEGGMPPISSVELIDAQNDGVSEVIMSGKRLSPSILTADAPPDYQSIEETAVIHQSELAPRAVLAAEIRRLASMIYHNGKPYKFIYGELNKMQKVKGQQYCTVAQLVARCRHLSSQAGAPLEIKLEDYQTKKTVATA